jgi:dTDP-4-dehydrorhamnose reductase
MSIARPVDMTCDVLVTGGNGQLGCELARTVWPQGWRAVTLGRDALDLGDPAAITARIADGHEGRPIPRSTRRRATSSPPGR